MTAIRTGETIPAPPEVLLRSNPWIKDSIPQYHPIAEQHALVEEEEEEDDDDDGDEEDENEFKTDGTSNNLDGDACDDNDDVIDSEDSHEEADGTARASAKRRKVSYKSSLLPVFAVSLYFIFL